MIIHLKRVVRDPVVVWLYSLELGALVVTAIKYGNSTTTYQAMACVLTSIALMLLLLVINERHLHKQRQQRIATNGHMPRVSVKELIERNNAA